MGGEDNGYMCHENRGESKATGREGGGTREGGGGRRGCRSKPYIQTITEGTVLN